MSGLFVFARRDLHIISVFQALILLIRNFLSFKKQTRNPRFTPVLNTFGKNHKT